MEFKPGIYSNEDVYINDTPLNSIDSSRVAWMVTDIDGWWGLPDTDVPDDPRPFHQDGSYDTSGKFLARSISLKGKILPTNGEKTNGPVARDALSRLVTLVRRTAILRVQSSMGVSQMARVRLNGKPLTRVYQSTGLTEFDIPLKASDPLKYSDSLHSDKIYLKSDMTGRTYDRVFNFNYGGLNTSDTVTITNSGSYETWPNFTINGPVIDPTIEHVDSGKFLSFNTTLDPQAYGAGNYQLLINSKNKQILTSYSSNARSLLAPNSNWFTLTPGENTLRFTGVQHVQAREKISVQTNYAKNPIPMLDVQPTSTSQITTNYATNPRPRTSSTKWTYTPGTSETGGNVLGTGGPTSSVLTRTNWAKNPAPKGVLTTFAIFTGGTGTTSATSIATDAIAPGDSTQLTTTARATITGTKTTGISGWSAQDVSYRTPVTNAVGDAITTSVYARYIGPSPSTTARLTATAYNAGGTATDTVTGPTTTLVSGAWTRLYVTLPITIVSASIGWQVSQTSTEIMPTGSVFDIKGLLIEKTNTLRDFFYGKTISPGPAGTGELNIYTFTGTENASTSTLSKSVDESALGPDGRVGFLRRYVTMPKTSGDSVFNFSAIAGDISGVAGNTVTSSVYVRSSKSVSVTPSIILKSGATLLGSYTVGSPVVLSENTWTRVQVKIPSASGSFNNFSFNLATSDTLTNGEWLDITNLLVTLGDTLYDYFDGGTSNHRNITYTWTGTDSSSVSAMWLVTRGWDVPEYSKFIADAETIDTRRSGTKSLKVTRTKVEQSDIHVASVSRMGACSSTIDGMPERVEDGVPDAASVYIKPSIGFCTASLKITYLSPTGAVLGSSSSTDQSIGAGVWSRLIYESTLPAPNGSAYIDISVNVLYNGSDLGHLGATTLFQDLKIGRSGPLSAEPYFDGGMTYAEWVPTSLPNSTISVIPQTVEEITGPFVSVEFRDAWME